jgi:hypothetical protein
MTTCHATVLRRSATGPAPTDTTVPPAVQAVLRSPGQPLDPAVRSALEPSFGRDFSQVRVHTGTEAAASAEAVQAHAYIHCLSGQTPDAPEQIRARPSGRTGGGGGGKR